MEIIFWKNKRELFYGEPFIIFLSFSLFVTFLSLTILYKFYWPIMVFFLILLVISILFLFLNKNLLSRVIFSEKGIVWKRFKKEISNIYWESVIDIKFTPKGKLVFLSFVANDSQIDVDLNQKMYDVIMLLCPSPNIKMMINNINYFKCYHKNDNKES